MKYCELHYISIYMCVVLCDENKTIYNLIWNVTFTVSVAFLFNFCYMSLSFICCIL